MGLMTVRRCGSIGVADLYSSLMHPPALAASPEPEKRLRYMVISQACVPIRHYTPEKGPSILRNSLSLETEIFSHVAQWEVDQRDRLFSVGSQPVHAYFGLLIIRYMFNALGALATGSLLSTYSEKGWGRWM